MTTKFSVSLTDERHAFARALVDEGRFPSVGAVFQHGIDVLRPKIEDEALERASLAEVMRD
jgi:antitoxin ParD1/3/4